jgi:TonB family protein
VLILLVAGLLRRGPTSTSAMPVSLVAAKGLPKPQSTRSPRSTKRTTEPKPVEKPPEPPRPPPTPEPVEPAPGVGPRDEPKQPDKPKPKQPAPPKPADPESATPPDGGATPASGAAPTPGIAASVDTGSFPYDYYLDAIVSRVSQSWVKPRTGLPSHSCMVGFELARDGRVSGLTVEVSSGSRSYDLSAMRAVDLASPLPRLPPAFHSPTLRVHFEFIP